MRLTCPSTWGPRPRDPGCPGGGAAPVLRCPRREGHRGRAGLTDTSVPTQLRGREATDAQEEAAARVSARAAARGSLGGGGVSVPSVSGRPLLPPDRRAAGGGVPDPGEAAGCVCLRSLDGRARDASQDAVWSHLESFVDSSCTSKAGIAIKGRSYFRIKPQKGRKSPF